MCLISAFASCEPEYERKTNLRFISLEDRKYQSYGENQFETTINYPNSEFMMKAEGPWFSRLRNILNGDPKVKQNDIRLESMVNFFDYDFPIVSPSEGLGVFSELSVCPWNEDHYLLMLATKSSSIPMGQIPAVNFSFVIDYTGSMGFEGRFEIAKQGMKDLVGKLRSNDRISIITYGGDKLVWLPSTQVGNKQEVLASIDALNPTAENGKGDAVTEAYSQIIPFLDPKGINQIVVLTDGDPDIFESFQSSLRIIDENREGRVGFEIIGLGPSAYDYNTMEKMGQLSGGQFRIVNNKSEWDKIFLNKLSDFYTTAIHLRGNITFNDNWVKEYRLLGYEHRNDFESEFVEDAFIGTNFNSEETNVVFYELKKDPDFAEGDIGVVSLRYTDLVNVNVEDKSIAIPSEVTPFANCSEPFRFGSGVLTYGLQLKHSAHRGQANKDLAVSICLGATVYDPGNHRKDWINTMQTVTPR